MIMDLETNIILLLRRLAINGVEIGFRPMHVALNGHWSLFRCSRKQRGAHRLTPRSISYAYPHNNIITPYLLFVTLGYLLRTPYLS
jgi:hypothetical protein